MLDVADAPRTDQEPGPAAVAGAVSPDVVGRLAGLDAPWTPAGPADAEDATRAIAAYCRTFCPVVHACVEDACRLWRLEQDAQRFLREGPEPGEGVIAL